MLLQGIRRMLPLAKHWTDDWNIDPPDVVIQMPKPVSLPATGDIDYTYVIVPTGFDQDRWVQMSETSSNRSRGRSSRGGLCARAGFSLAARRAHRHTIHGVLAAARTGSPRRDVDRQRSFAGLRARQFTRSLASRNGEAREGRVRSRFSDALHVTRNRLTGSDPHWTGLCEGARPRKEC